MRADKLYGLSVEDRKEMLARMVSDILRSDSTSTGAPRVILDTYFIDHPEIQTTSRAEYAHATAHHSSPVRLVYGADVLPAMVEWWDLDRTTGINTLHVAKNVPKTIVTRPETPPLSPEIAAQLAETEYLEMTRQFGGSSTQARTAPSRTALDEVVIPEIADYIVENNLYNCNTQFLNS